MRMHQGLKPEDWFKRSLVEQMANIGADVERALDAFAKNDKEKAMAAFYRALELLQYTKMDRKNKKRIKELCRLYELLGEYFAGENKYNLSEDWIRKYFRFFYLAWVREKENLNSTSKTLVNQAFS